MRGRQTPVKKVEFTGWYAIAVLGQEWDAQGVAADVPVLSFLQYTQVAEVAEETQESDTEQWLPDFNL